MNVFEIKQGYFKVFDGKTSYDLYIDENRDFSNLPDPEFIYRKAIDRGLTESQVIDLMLKFLHRRRIFKGDYLGDLSLCVAFIGPRGSGKSVGLTGVSVIDGLLAGRRVVSNLPIQLKVKYRDCEKILESEDLDAVSMLDINELDANYYDCIICIDEANVFMADSMRSNSNQAVFFGFVLQQMRHRKLDFIFNTQNEEWLTGRMRYQVDFYVKCRDYAMLSPGKPKKSDIGRKTRWEIHDMSGLVTGEVLHSDRRTYAVPPYSEKVFWNVPFWGCYSTELLQKREKFLGKQNSGNSLSFDTAKMEKIQYEYDVPFRMVSTIINCGYERAEKSHIWQLLGVSGDKSMQTKLGKIFNDIGCRTVNKKDYIFPTQAEMVKNLNELGIQINKY